MEKETEDADILAEDTLKKHFGDPTGFSRVSNSLVRLYTLLPEFNSDVVGLYAYMWSWRMLYFFVLKMSSISFPISI
ncbi:hypothetical protein A6283_05670 [Bacillus wiedmannii]|uniref:hypothetical protein n=1 Tax=Bacillus TaxID=1386 RepID=UPI00065BAD79|nr:MULTISPECIES: hypothetical protein [Bacillus]KMP26351.1 hypothetical protein TU50_23255 [Bacillus wiedmannii]KXY06283.1 hypothetical protein AT260_13865 [Bacillus wiedmannii]MBJ8082389.1 hypothetical protein [Bacillus cereus group sp. N14]MCT6915007.1 hypothetical protein [Bacillus wiedmannii]MDI6675171.1 hypothetical protein [Bacillus wiedmannii]